MVAHPDDICPEERPAGLERPGVVAVVDPANRHATASVAGVQQAVSTHPVSGVRDPAVQPSGARSSGSSSRGPAVGRQLSSRLLSSCPVSARPSGRVRLLPLRRWRWGPGRGGRATVTTGTGEGPGGCRAVDGSIDGRGGRDSGDAARGRVGQGEVGGGPGPLGWCGPRRPRLPR